MKKIIMGVCALALAGAFTACHKQSSDEATTYNDTLSTAYGQYVGAVLNSQISNMSGDRAFDKGKVLQGMQAVLNTTDDESVHFGMQIALQLMEEMKQMKNEDINLDKKMVVEGFTKMFRVDSMSRMDVREYATKFNDYLMDARQAAITARAAGPSADDYVEMGRQYLADQMAADSDIKTTDSGLGYKIEKEGEGEKAGANSTVTVKYTGRHTDGSVFDTTEGRQPAEFNLQGVVPGFREGIMLLGKGGKATLYIPGELAYGVNGQPGANIGPNEMLVFEVEVLDIN